jgi:UrcA family protein
MNLCINQSSARALLLSAVVNAALFTSVVVGLTLPASAAHAETPSVTLLTSEFRARASADYAGLYERIGRAAARVCESYRYATGTRIDRAFRKCVSETVADTVTRVNDATLSAYHRQQTGGKATARIAAATADGSE